MVNWTIVEQRWEKMDRKIHSGIMLTLLLIGMLTLAFNIQGARADSTWTETIYIRADGSIEPDTAPISTVDNTTYVLTGNVVGDFPDYTSAIIVERTNVTIDGSGYTLQRVSGIYTDGLSLYGVNMTIKNIKIKGFYDGIYVNSTSHTINIFDNIIMESANWGIDLSSNNTVLGNNIIDSHIGIAAGSNNVITGNNIAASNVYGILAGSSNTIYGNNITANDDAGIHLYSCSDNAISGNNIRESYHGIELSHCSNNAISGNNIAANRGFGIYTSVSFDNTIWGNNITRNRSGIGVSYSSNNTIFGNNVTRSASAGIIITSSSLTNIVYGNNIINNTYGSRFDGLTTCPSNNILYHNNFINNTNQVYFRVGGENTWDDGYPSGGNHWSDYEDRYPDATEIDNSGIWDTPYVIDGNNQDNYPLMEPWTPTPPIPTTIDELKTEIEELGSEGQIDNRGIVKSLLAKLNVAQKLIDKGKIEEAKSILEEDFIPQVQNLTDIHITKEAAELLIESAEYIISNTKCMQARVCV